MHNLQQIGNTVSRLFSGRTRQEFRRLDTQKQKDILIKTVAIATVIFLVGALLAIASPWALIPVLFLASAAGAYLFAHFTAEARHVVARVQDFAGSVIGD